MNHFSLLRAICFALVSTVPTTASLALYEPDTNSSQPVPPSLDPFYTGPLGFENTIPGTVLRIRNAPGNLTTLVTNSSAAYNILFRTTDSNYKPSWAVTTVLVPLLNASIVANNSQACLLSYQIPYNSADVDASPSYAIYASLSAAPAGVPSYVDDLSAALGNGWFVNVPDHEGPLASFGLGIQEGHTTLDAIRAVLSASVLPSRSKTKYAMWGYSGGSIASEWASELQEQYAPELAIAGVALGGLVTDPKHAADLGSGTAFAGLQPEVLLGMTSQDPEARDYLVSRLNPTGLFNSSTFLEALNMDIATAFTVFANQDISKYFVGGAADLEAPIIRRLFQQKSQLGFHGVPRSPVFVYKAIADELAPISDSDAIVDRWCGIGTSVLSERNTVGGHVAEITNGRLRALEWLKTVFQGTVATQGCVVRNVSVAITDIPF